jgi:hypothetical protein
LIGRPRCAARALRVAVASLLVASVSPSRAALAQNAGDRIQAGVGYWWPATVIHASGEAGGIQGTPIDFGSDFGLVNRGFPTIQMAGRPATRHELSFAYVPIRYDTNAVLGHDVTFAGTRYPAGVGTEGIVSWNALRFRYTYDVVRRARVSIGVIGEIDRTDVKVRLANAASSTATRASVRTTPTAGAVVRVRATGRLTVRAEASGIYVPDRKDEIYGGHLLNAEAGGTWTLRRHVGADLGFRLIDIRHLGQADSGTLRLHGLTLGVIVGR